MEPLWSGPLGPFEYLATIRASEIVRFKRVDVHDGAERISAYVQTPTRGVDILRPSLKVKLDHGATA